MTLTNSIKDDHQLATTVVASAMGVRTLSEHRQAQIHSVFPNGFNLSCGGQLTYMGAYYPGRLSANGLMIERSAFKKLQPHLKEGQRVRITDEALTFYTRPQVMTLKILEIKERNLSLPNLSFSDLKAGKLLEQLNELNPVATSGFAKVENINNILQDVREQARINIEAVRQLIGAGVGLTPSGDDFLQGMIVLEKLTQSEPMIEDLVKEALTDRRTTAVSETYYDVLFAGYVNEPWILLFDAIKARDDARITDALSHIKNYGKTSGSDFLTGAQTYLQIKG